jgi:hypothetical protein
MSTVRYHEGLQGITALPHRYCGGVNRPDPEAVMRCFADDAVWTFDTPGDNDGLVPLRYQGVHAAASFIRNAAIRRSFNNSPE